MDTDRALKSLKQEPVARRSSGRAGHLALAIMKNHTAYLLPSYFVLDITIRSLELNLLRGQATVISLHVNNLLDSRGAEPGALGVDIPRLGRTWFLRASQEF